VPSTSVQVTALSPVAEFVAVTVAPGIDVFPDFTTPTMEKRCAEGGGLWANELGTHVNISASTQRLATRAWRAQALEFSFN
jgi:hypothetical protein